VNGQVSRWLGVLVVAFGLAAVLVPLANQASAQASKSVFKGAAQKKGEPVKINAASLEVRDKDKTATFSGDVQVIQGDTELRCNSLVVFYEGDLSKGAKSTDGQRNQQIRRMEARGNVLVIQKDQRATGDHGDFDMRNNTVTLTGNVVVMRGVDVLRGQRLLVNLTTGVSQVESGGGRVEALINPNQGQDQQGKGEGLPRPKRNK
jgi:lipopolysaccharide export system protein LptA